jgi:hypothetical protein
MHITQMSRSLHGLLIFEDVEESYYLLLHI